MTRRKPRDKDATFLDFNIKDLLNQLFVLHLQAEAFLHEVKKNLELTDLSNLFDFMDVDNNGFLTLNEVKKILILV
jgi:hypothetical protein